MLNVMVVNFKEDNEELLKLFHAQVDVAYSMDWPVDKIKVISNRELSYRGVIAEVRELNKVCLTSKLFALPELMDKYKDEVLWVHDLDVWQNVPFTEPTFKEIGACKYLTDYYNGGSIFYRSSAKDIVEEMCEIILSFSSSKEEPILNAVLKAAVFKDRVTELNSTYNVGSNGLNKRYNEAEKPVKCYHFHPNHKPSLNRFMSLDYDMSTVLKDKLKLHYIK
jgi:hypothetical protein